MRLHLVVVVRNEADIWPEFLSQACSLFDRIAVIDHQSTDGTSEISQEFIGRGNSIKSTATPIAPIYRPS